MCGPWCGPWCGPACVHRHSQEHIRTHTDRRFLIAGVFIGQRNICCCPIIFFKMIVMSDTSFSNSRSLSGLLPTISTYFIGYTYMISMDGPFYNEVELSIIESGNIHTCRCRQSGEPRYLFFWFGNCSYVNFLDISGVSYLTYTHH